MFIFPSKEYATLSENIKKTRTDTQTKFYKVVARPTLLYGSETWVTTARGMTRLGHDSPRNC